MADSGMLLLLLVQFVTSVLLIDVSQIEVYPKHGSVSGVFHAWLSGGYAFNASVAREVCERLGVVMADKAQVEKALTLGFETCKFGWIDEQVTVIPRIQSKVTCGQGQVGIITWRTSLASKYDVFCFNFTDYEARLNMAQKNLSTAATPRAHPRLANTTPLASREDVWSSSSSFPEPVDESLVSKSPEKKSPESQGFSDTSPTTAVGLIALLTTVFAFLLLVVSAICFLKKNNVSRWNKKHQKVSARSEICENTDEEVQAEVKNQHKMTSNTNNVSVTIRMEKDDGATTNGSSL